MLFTSLGVSLLPASAGRPLHFFSSGIVSLAGLCTELVATTEEKQLNVLPIR